MAETHCFEQLCQGSHVSCDRGSPPPGCSQLLPRSQQAHSRSLYRVGAPVGICAGVAALQLCPLVGEALDGLPSTWVLPAAHGKCGLKHLSGVPHVYKGHSVTGCKGWLLKWGLAVECWHTCTRPAGMHGSCSQHLQPVQRPCALGACRFMYPRAPYGKRHVCQLVNKAAVEPKAPEWSRAQ